MKKHFILYLALIGLSLGACGSGQSDEVAVLTAPEADQIIELDEVPAELKAVIAARNPGFTAQETVKKIRGDRVYYDVEGLAEDGTELEYDILMTPSGPQIVEEQRDIDVSALPDVVRDMALSASQGVEPARIIESRQNDGTIIFELFKPGYPEAPAYEIRFADGQAEALTERWPH